MPQRQGHDPYDNAGPNIRGLGKDDVTAQEELAAFDQLGPLTRRVINDALCVRWSSQSKNVAGSPVRVLPRHVAWQPTSSIPVDT